MSDDVTAIIERIPKKVMEVFMDNAERIFEKGNFEYIFEGKKYTTNIIDTTGNEALIEIMLPDHVCLYAYKKGTEIEYRLTPKYF